jgi:FkbM family methyltransferase
MIKEIVATPIAKMLIVVSCLVPPLRHCFTRLGITPAHFGNRVVRVPIRNRSDSLLLTGAGSVHLTFQLFWRGIDYYEPFTRTVIEALASQAKVFVDVGANIGFFSLIAAKLNPSLEVIAFEPNAEMFALLSEHKRLNGLSNLTAEPVALSNRDGEGQLFLNKSDMSASLVPDFQDGFNPALRSVPVKITTLDAYVQRHSISGSLLLKVDVEGHDKAFLEGAQATIAKFKPDMVVEVLGDFDPLLLDQFRNHGYQFYRITNQGLIESETVTLTKIGNFVFFNYLFTTKSITEVHEISEIIRERARRINLCRTSKFPEHPV